MRFQDYAIRKINMSIKLSAMKRLGLWGKCLHGCCGQRQMLFDAACAWFILLQKVKSSKRLKLFEVLQM
jgi:hypothetical protein